MKIFSGRYWLIIIPILIIGLGWACGGNSNGGGNGDGSNVPAAPSNLHTTAISLSEIDLTWKDNSDNEDGFKIEQKAASGGTYAEAVTLSVGLTSCRVLALQCSTGYYFRVNAYNSLGVSNYSNEINASTETCPTNFPGGGLGGHN